MKYVTGVYALNLQCSLDTGGDWHQPCLDWRDSIRFKDSGNSVLGDFGIEEITFMPGYTLKDAFCEYNTNRSLAIQKYGKSLEDLIQAKSSSDAVYRADHIRACLDLLIDGRYRDVTGMRNSFLDDKYMQRVFEALVKMKCLDNWDEIYNFIIREYGMRWVLFERNGYEWSDNILNRKPFGGRLEELRNGKKSI